jgi:hypothetical protein
MGQGQPTDITKPAAHVTQKIQCPVLCALRTELIESPSSASADRLTFLAGTLNARTSSAKRTHNHRLGIPTEHVQIELQPSLRNYKVM